MTLKLKLKVCTENETVMFQSVFSPSLLQISTKKQTKTKSGILAHDPSVTLMQEDDMFIEINTIVCITVIFSQLIIIKERRS